MHFYADAAIWIILNAHWMLLDAAFAQVRIGNYNTVAISDTWSVKLLIHHNDSIEALHQRATEIASLFGMTNYGQVGELVGHYIFASNNSDKLEIVHEDIEWFSRQEILKRCKRASLKQLYDDDSFEDPLYPQQWHLHNHNAKIDCNVTGVWKSNIAGRGVVVAVVDDGVQWMHPDLVDNYSPEGSYDLNADDGDPTPEPDDKDKNAHGTRCAGEIAAVPNKICGVGVAFRAKFSGIRVLDGPMTDSLEATAFNKHFDVNDIYSCSWGPEDDGKTVDGPRQLAQAALMHGIMAGRNGFGSIFVVASGNGGSNDDNCNFDGYASSIYTITIAAVDEFGSTPSYAEQCTSMLASTVSSGGSRSRSRKITTTDWTLNQNKAQCTNEHSGTSAATPLVAGMIALMLEARPCLTWRDVQYIIVMTATPLYKVTSGVNRNHWQTNAAGFEHNDYNGFGLLDGWKLVNAARIWKTLPWLTSLKPSCIVKDYLIPVDGKTPLVLEAEVSQQECDDHLLQTLEQITITLSLTHSSRGDLRFTLACPSGTTSVVPTRKKDKSNNGLESWTFSTVKCWGEKPSGKYQLNILDTLKKGTAQIGKVKEWQLTLYGSKLTPADILQRKAVIRNALSGEFLSPDSNFSVSCPLGQVPLDESQIFSEKTLKLLILLACTFAFSGVYYTIEMAFCNAEDKKENSETVNNCNENSYNATLINEDSVMQQGNDANSFNLKSEDMEALEAAETLTSNVTTDSVKSFSSLNPPDDSSSISNYTEILLTSEAS